MTGMLDKLKQWVGRTENTLKEESKGGEPVATPSAGSGGERETSTNAQGAGASDEPWSGNR